MLNEQGATTFRMCKEDDSTLIDDEIGAWSMMDVSEATLSSLDGGVSFTVVKPKDADFRRGRESISGRLSWAGLSLSFDAHHNIKYTIKLGHREHTT